MGLSRRGFLKVTAAGGLGISALGFDLKPAYAASRQLDIASVELDVWAQEQGLQKIERNVLGL